MRRKYFPKEFFSKRDDTSHVRTEDKPLLRMIILTEEEMKGGCEREGRTARLDNSFASNFVNFFSLSIEKMNKGRLKCPLLF